ncbi:TolB-like translocation protein [Streptomyces tateyamensis]|uniref:TolB-like translocation protein n=1 Tax=Streptomyces tateyamensis TaxID=565073 RepID=A0A2V4NJY7_9ACTN|nr:TolB-like translocation protein [Streptomyces tateyamensis]PYC73043.1 TolB-like translocation protein [Streptomyces tateyamensis]
MTRRARLTVLLVTLLLLAGVGTASVLRAADRAHRRDQAQPGGPVVAVGAVSLRPAARTLVFRSTAWGPHRDELSTVPADRPGDDRTAAGVRCDRFYAAAGTGICLRAKPGAVQDSYQAVVLDAGLHDLKAFPLAGIPSRSRVSPSGHLAAWTVFTSGDNYGSLNFSTRTSIVDTRDWRLEENLESFTVLKDGQPYHAQDINVWGVTFADDTAFYATVASGGQTWLVRGDLGARTLTTLHGNVECPSLSPDGTRIAYKHRVAGATNDVPWLLYVLDLRTGTETATAETRGVDDQAVWSDDHTLVYALPGDYGADLWTVPADGSGAPARLLGAALAPAYLG